GNCGASVRSARPTGGRPPPRSAQRYRFRCASWSCCALDGNWGNGEQRTALFAAHRLAHFLRKRSSRTTSAPPVGLSCASSEVAAAGSVDFGAAAAAEVARACLGAGFAGLGSCLGSAGGRSTVASSGVAGAVPVCGASAASVATSNLTPNGTEGSTKPLI